MRQAGILAAAAALALGVAAATADEAAELVIDGQHLVTRTAAPEGHPLPELLSGWRFRTDETQALQTDDFDNPAFVFVEKAIDAWNRPDGTEGKSCASCHGDAAESMKGVRAAMPKWNDKAGEIWSLETFVNDCRVNRMGAAAWRWQGDEMTAMTALIGLQSRGMPIQVAIDGPAREWWEQGREIYYTRYGQLELACANCHEENAGNMIRADHLSQGQSNGFPTYRLRDQKLVSLHQRFWGCIRDTRGEPFEVGSPEFRALEFYVAWRGTGLSVETPSVRN